MNFIFCSIFCSLDFLPYFVYHSLVILYRCGILKANFILIPCFWRGKNYAHRFVPNGNTIFYFFYVIILNNFFFVINLHIKKNLYGYTRVYITTMQLNIHQTILAKKMPTGREAATNEIF